MTESHKNLAKNRIQYECESCQFITGNKTDYNKHCLTAKHKKHQKTPKNTLKNAKYTCETCDFVTDNKKHYERHLLTDKHLKNTKHSNELQIEIKEKEECDEEMKKMVMKLYEKMFEIFEKQEEIAENTNEKLLELAEKQEDTNEKLMELANRPTTINNTQNNNHFTMNVFLDKVCKEAVNIIDFLKSIQDVQPEEIEKFGKLGYIKGHSQIISKRLDQLGIEKRPIHCTDEKRNTLYIKMGDDTWTKNKEDYQALVIQQLMILCKSIGNKIFTFFPYRHAIDDHDDYPMKQVKMFVEIFDKGDGEEEIEERHIQLLQTIGKNVTIDKSKYKILNE